MKTKYILATVVLVLIALFFLGISKAEATTGGPTFLMDFRAASNAQPLKQFVYTMHNWSGRGCPPEVFSFDIQTQARTVLHHCDALDTRDPNGQAKYDAKMADVLAKYPVQLNRINLINNRISAKVTMVRENIEDAGGGQMWATSTSFTLDVFQNNVKKASYPFFGCKIDQPNVIEGYTLPGNNFFVLRLSAVGDCYEGGYNRDRIFILPSVTITDPQALPIEKEIKPAIADASGTNGNLIVVAGQASAPVATENNSETPTVDNSGPNLLVHSVILIAGAAFGYVIAKLIGRKV